MDVVDEYSDGSDDDDDSADKSDVHEEPISLRSTIRLQKLSPSRY